MGRSKILDRHLIVQNIIHFGHLLYHRNFSLQTRVALKRNRQSVLKNVSLRDNQPGTKIVINFSIAVLTMLREFQYIKPTETFEDQSYLVLIASSSREGSVEFMPMHSLA